MDDAQNMLFEELNKTNALRKKIDQIQSKQNELLLSLISETIAPQVQQVSSPNSAKNSGILPGTLNQLTTAIGVKDDAKINLQAISLPLLPFANNFVLQSNPIDMQTAFGLLGMMPPCNK